MGAPVKTRSAFLDLPPEIREQVYGGLFSDASGIDVQILRTSQQIYVEAQPFLFKRPVTFASQFDFYEWVRISSAHNRKYVQCVRIKLVDVISHEGLPSESIQEYRRNSPSPITRTYEDDLSRFVEALKGVPNVRSLTLYKNRTGDSDLFRDFHRECFAAVAKQFPGLKSLTFYVDQIPLDFLGSFRSLQSLRFTGFSTSSPKDTIKALQKLSKLDELELFGPPPALAFLQRTGYEGVRATQSMTAEVIKHLNPLRACTICEIRDPYAHPNTDVFVSKALLTALGHAHSRSLRRLRISTDFTPASESRTALAALLAASTSLQELELGWPGFSEGRLLIDALPPSLRTLQITVGVGLKPDELAERIIIARKKSKLPALREVVLRTDWREAQAKELSKTVETALTKLKNAGITRASRGSWYPIILDCLDQN